MSLVSNCYKCRPIKIYICITAYILCYLISLFGFSPFFPRVGFDPVIPLIIPFLKKKEGEHERGKSIGADKSLLFVRDSGGHAVST